MSRMSLLAIVLAAATLGLAIAQPTTLGTRADVYTYASNVMGYINMTADYCDIRAAVSAGNFTAALEIYSTGKNSFTGLGRRTFYRFAILTPSAGEVEPIHDALAMGRNSTWLDSLIRDAAAKRNGPLMLGLLQIAALKYAFHEMDEAYNKLNAYVRDPANNAGLIDPITGAPHSVDEVFALWAAGGSPTICATPSTWAAKLGTEMDASFLGRAHVNTAMTLAINELLATSLSGSAPAYNTTRYTVQRIVAVLGLQGVIHSAYKLQAALGCRRPTTDILEAQAMITVHWTYLRPILVARNVPAVAINQLQVALTVPRPHYTRSILPIARTVMAALGLRASDIGVPNFDLVAAGWGCRSTVMARRLMA